MGEGLSAPLLCVACGDVMGSAWMRSVLVSPDGSWRVPIPIEPEDYPITIRDAIVLETIGGAAPDDSDLRLHIRRADERWAVAHASCVSGNEDNILSAIRPTEPEA